MHVRVYLCVCVCPEAAYMLITGGMMRHDMDPTCLVNQVLQLLYGSCSWYR